MLASALRVCLWASAWAGCALLAYAIGFTDLAVHVVEVGPLGPTGGGCDVVVYVRSTIVDMARAERSISSFVSTRGSTVHKIATTITSVLGATMVVAAASLHDAGAWSMATAVTMTVAGAALVAIGFFETTNDTTPTTRALVYDYVHSAVAFVHILAANAALAMDGAIGLAAMGMGAFAVYVCMRVVTQEDPVCGARGCVRIDARTRRAWAIAFMTVEAVALAVPVGYVLWRV